MKCIFCGGQIRKYTRTNWVETEARRMPYMKASSRSMYHFPLTPPKTKADCQRMTNELVVSVQKHHSGDGTVRSFGTWDGESYVDNFFCNGDHARKFAYAAARAGWRRTK